MYEYVFWQQILSPHISRLATALAEQGHSVRYLLRDEMSTDRARAGWAPPPTHGVAVERVFTLNDVRRLVEATRTAIHIVEGLKRNGFVRSAVKELRRWRCRWGPLLETIDDRGIAGIIKRFEYRFELQPRHRRPDFVLAIGARTPSWMVSRGMPAERVFPFTYFLAEPPVRSRRADPEISRACLFRFGFVGGLVPRKRVDLLLEAVSGLKGFELVIVGSGPLEVRLKASAARLLPDVPIVWRGQTTMDEARRLISELDCLILPSKHDGWGAVVAEALLEGVPVICSDACGSSEAVRASNCGGVFASGSVEELRTIARRVLSDGPLPEERRKRLKLWAASFTGSRGAEYLTRIVDALYGSGPNPRPPWDDATQRVSLLDPEGQPD